MSARKKKTVYIELTDSDDDLPTLDVLLARRKLNPAPPASTKRAQPSITTPRPPIIDNVPLPSTSTPPLASTSRLPLPPSGSPDSPLESGRRSPSIISDSENELPSSRRPDTSGGGLSASAALRQDHDWERRESFFVPDSEEDESGKSFEQDPFIADLSPVAASPIPTTSLLHPQQTISGPPSPPSPPPTSRYRLPPSSHRKHRRLTIQFDGSSSDEEPPAVGATPVTPGRKLDEVECTCGDVLDEEPPVLSPPLREDEEHLSLYSEDSEENRNLGILVYAPTPRRNKPSRLSPSSLLNTPSGRTIVISPTSTPGSNNPTPKPRKPISKRIDIDLTGDSSDSGDTDPPLPSRTPQNRKHPIFALSVVPSSATPVHPTPRPPPTPKSKAKSRRSPNLLSAEQKQTLPIELIRELDRSVFRKSWDGMRCLDKDGEMSGKGLPDGLVINWSKKLRNTAGRASWKKTVVNGNVRHNCTIELAEKVIDTEGRLRSTLAHELVHIAAWILSGEIKPSHGPAFKLWGRRIMKKHPDISITTTHTYEIAYKYRWKCSVPSCGKIFSRHSRSINPTTHGCSCRGTLVEIDDEGNRKAVRGTPKRSGYQDFLVSVSPQIRRDNPGITQPEVVQLAAGMWRSKKEAAAEKDVELEEAMDKLVL